MITNRYLVKTRFIGIVLSSILPMLYGYYQYFEGSGHVVLGKHTDRIASYFGYANLYGIFLALIIFSAAILYIESSNKRWKRIKQLIKHCPETYHYN